VDQLLLISFETSQAFAQRSLINRSCIVIHRLPRLNANQSRYLLAQLV
jgi:hypothetical protein